MKKTFKQGRITYVVLGRSGAHVAPSDNELVAWTHVETGEIIDPVRRWRTEGKDYVSNQGEHWNNGRYLIVKKAKEDPEPKRSHKNKPRKTALERAESVEWVASTDDIIKAIEKQIQLAVKAAFQRKARKNDR